MQNSVYSQTSMGQNVAIGAYALQNDVSLGIGHHVAIGWSAMSSASPQGASVGIGYQALINDTGGNNIGIGFLAGQNILSGYANLYIGNFAGGNTISGYYNVGIGYSAGPAADYHNTVSIGTFASAGANNVAVFANGLNVGINTNTPAYELDVNGTTNTHGIAISGVTGTAGQVITATGTGAGVQWSNPGIVHVQTITSSSYTIQTTDYYIGVNYAGAVALNLPASPISGQSIIIKDQSGAARTNNITVSGNGHTIDGSASIVLNTNYISITVIYNGNWFIY